MSEEQRLSTSRSIAAESEQLFDLVRRAALLYEEQFYTLWKARYPEEQAEELEHSATWTFARN